MCPCNLSSNCKDWLVVFSSLLISCLDTIFVLLALRTPLVMSNKAEEPKKNCTFAWINIINDLKSRKKHLWQADLSNSSAEDYLFGGSKQYSIQREIFPDLPGKSLHHSTDEPELHGIENKGYPMRVHILVSMQRTLIPLESVIDWWDHSIP